MQLESLANESLLDILEYLNGVHILRAFYRLNYRFDSLLFTHFQSNVLSFRSCSKTDFDIVCQQYLPLISDQITSLCLFDNDDTSEQTQCFLAHNLTLDHFTHLQSLSLTGIQSRTIMDKMINELCHLSHLIHLSINWCRFRSSYLDNIWRLSQLIRCSLNNIDTTISFKTLTVISLSLQHLSIPYLYKKNSFEHFFECTPHLRQLTLRFPRGCGLPVLPFEMPSIEKLNLSLGDAVNGLNNFVERMPSLCQLTVQVRENYADGYEWQQMIIDHLPKLRVLRFLMDFTFEGHTNGEERVDQILDTFRTRFWIHNRQWFVRCHWKSTLEDTYGCLYTLPCTFSSLRLDTGMQFKSTCSHDNDYQLYNHVFNLSYYEPLFTNFLKLRFRHVHYLSVDFPLENEFWSVVTSVNRVTSLCVSSDDDTSVLPQLQALIHRAPHLYSVTFLPNSVSHIFDLTSKSIYRINLNNIRSYFDEQLCSALSRSSLGIQCQVLSIKVKDRTNIVYLVNNMKSLRALSVQCQDDTWENKYDSDSDSSDSDSDLHLERPIEDELVKWLERHLPCTCSISREKSWSFDGCINLWIR